MTPIRGKLVTVSELGGMAAIAANANHAGVAIS